MTSLCSLISVVALGIGAAGGFEPAGSDHGVDVYLRPDPRFIDLMSVGEFNAPPDEVQRVLVDYAAATRLTERLAVSRVLAHGDHELYVYQRLSLPVVSDRDYTLRVTWQERGGVVITRFNVANDHGPPPVPGVVRVSQLTGSWTLEPIRGGSATRGVYHVQLDMAGSIPRFMVRPGAAKDLPKLFEGVRRLVAERHGMPRAAASSPSRGM